VYTPLENKNKNNHTKGKVPIQKIAMAFFEVKTLLGLVFTSLKFGYTLVN
jgi:hypothetical protein